MQISGEAYSTCYKAKCGKTDSLRNFYELILYMCRLFRFNTSPNKLSVSCDYCNIA